MQEKKSTFKRNLVATTVVGSAIVSGSAMATTAEDIAAAFASGQTNLAAVAAGVIALAAIMTGVGIVVRWLSR